MAKLQLGDGSFINVPDDATPEQVQAIYDAATSQGSAPMEPEALSPVGLATNFPADAYEAGANIVNSVRHPLEGLEAMGDLAAGYASRLPFSRPSWMPDVRTDEKRRQQQLTAEGFDKMMSDNFSTPTRAWNTIVRNPADTALTAVPLLGPMAKVAKLSGAARTAAALEKAAEFSNPVNLVAKPAGALLDRFAPRVPGLPRMTSALLRNAAPADLTEFDKLGPAGRTLDWSPSTVGLAQGVTVAPGEAKNIILDALTQRHKGRSDRLLHGTQNVLGRLRDPAALKKTIDKAGQRRAGPHYRLAKENPPDIRTPALENLLAQQMTEPMKGMSMSKRAKTMEYFKQIEDAWFADNPADVVSRLHGIRKDLDTKIYDHKTAGDDLVVAKEVRKTIDDILKNRVPGFMEGDDIIHTAKKAQEDIDFGYDALDGGKSAMFPETFGKEYAKRDPKWVAEGLKGRVANALGTSANDTSAMKRVIGDGNDFNRRKLTKTFGQDKTDKVVGLVDAEDTMAQNFADIARNSQTAQRNAAAAQTGQLKLPEISTSATITGTIGNSIAKAVNKLLSKGTARLSDVNNRALTEALMASGPQARLLFQMLKNPPRGVGRVNDTKVIKALLAGNVAGGASEFPRGLR